jgi:hypothetical protein
VCLPQEFIRSPIATELLHNGELLQVSIVSGMNLLTPAAELSVIIQCQLLAHNSLSARDAQPQTQLSTDGDKT